LMMMYWIVLALLFEEGVRGDIVEGSQLIDIAGPCRMPPGMTTNIYGKPECICQSGLYLHNETQSCHKLYTAGPCSPGQILELATSSGHAVCVENHCPGSQVFSEAAGCVELGNSCKTDDYKSGVFSVIVHHNQTAEVICNEQQGTAAGFSEASISRNGCRVGYFRSYNGRCRPKRLFSRCPPGKIMNVFGICSKPMFYYFNSPF